MEHEERAVLYMLPGLNYHSKACQSCHRCCIFKLFIATVTGLTVFAARIMYVLIIYNYMGTAGLQ
jgi:hypothetical protein